MNKSYKRPESVLVVVITTAGEALMMRRANPADFWQSVTGSMKPGESPRHAAERELYEETGLLGQGRLLDAHRSVTFPIRPAWRSRYAPGVQFNHEHWFYYRIPSRRQIKLNQAEHREYRWLPISQAVRLASSWTNRKALSQIKFG